jgi:5-methylcytosine-specific restriction enzyme A
MITTEQFQKAFEHLLPNLGELPRSILEALFFAYPSGYSSRQLALLLGHSSLGVINLNFGRLGNRIQKIVRSHPDDFSAGEYEWWVVLALGAPSEVGFLWFLRDEVVEALNALNFATDQAFSLAEEVEESEILIEGSTRTVVVNSYERNPIARRRCIEAHGTSCCVCGFNFEERYGPMAAGFIHVHHLTPIAQIGVEYEIDPVADLRPVCPNCHAVIHLRNPPHSIEEAKAMLQRAF